MHKEKGTHAKNMELAVCRALHSGVVVASQYTVASPSRGLEWRKRARKRSRPLLDKSVDDQGADEAGHGDKVGGVQPGLPIQLLLMCTCEN